MKSYFAKLDDAIVWIAANDDPTEADPAVVAEQMTVLLVADIFGRQPSEIVPWIIRLREVMA